MNKWINKELTNTKQYKKHNNFNSFLMEKHINIINQ